jgi:hypothetical protein
MDPLLVSIITGFAALYGTSTTTGDAVTPVTVDSEKYTAPVNAAAPFVKPVGHPPYDTRLAKMVSTRTTTGLSNGANHMYCRRSYAEPVNATSVAIREAIAGMATASITLVSTMIERSDR